MQGGSAPHRWSGATSHGAEGNLTRAQKEVLLLCWSHDLTLAAVFVDDHPHQPALAVISNVAAAAGVPPTIVTATGRIGSSDEIYDWAREPRPLWTVPVQGWFVIDRDRLSDERPLPAPLPISRTRRKDAP